VVDTQLFPPEMKKVTPQSFDLNVSAKENDEDMQLFAPPPEMKNP